MSPCSLALVLRVDLTSKSYLIQRSKQDFMQVNIKLFLEKRQGLLLEQRGILGLIRYLS